MKTSPTSIAQSMYAAFARSDITAILAQLRHDIEWRANVDPAAPGADSIPFFRARRGPAAVGEFFQQLADNLEFHSFEPVSFMASDREVAVRVLLEFNVRPTGKRVRTESMHHWTFDESGKAARFVEYADTLAAAASWDRVQAVPVNV